MSRLHSGQKEHINILGIPPPPCSASDSRRLREKHRRCEVFTTACVSWRLREPLPPSDPFWLDFYPPNGWNCRCDVVQVRKSKYPQTDHDEAVARGEGALQKDTKRMFRFNPGAERSTVPAYNPYTISKCRSCDIPRDSLSLARLTPPDSQLCTACTLLHKMVKAEKESVIEQSEKKAIKDAAKEWAKRHLPVIADHGGQPAQRLIIRNNPTGLDFVLNKKFFGETFSNCVRADNTAETMELATRIEEWLPNATEGRIEKGRDHDFDFKVMNADFEGKRIEIKAKITAKELILYTMRVYK